MNDRSSSSSNSKKISGIDRRVYEQLCVYRKHFKTHLELNVIIA